MPSPTIDATAAESKLIRNALEMADHVHEGQTRNGSGGMAYIHHPVAVAELLAEHGYGEEVVAAALLHDVVENSEIGVDQLSSRFGRPVSQLVEALSDDESIQPYEHRKNEHRRRVVEAGADALAIYAADKLSNIRVLRRTYASEGEAVAEDFEVSLDIKEGVWAADLEMLHQEVPDLPFVDDLVIELAELRKARATRTSTSPS